VINGYLAAQRILATAPNLEVVGLLSRSVNSESAYVGYTWTGRDFPGEQEAQVGGNGLVSKRMKTVQLIKQGQAVEPKEGDDLYLRSSLFAGTWGRWTIKRLDVEFDRNVFRCHSLFSAVVGPLTINLASLPSGQVGIPY
jgi:hypothetical protein